ncbi:CG6272 [Drosophila busckii]|uniref:CG6272 n=1 Tax=Drosophila busckii TaxID=30019 RepID=A0A0M4EFQ6_DROBS|nr:CCAAT/enhancer-binding protein gamma [Drosophila busckii]ALC43127.1 CG6272 [Drosophila busckii]
MPARRRTAGPSTSTGGGSTETSPQSDDPAYKLKRKKNNEAVQRTREKTKKSAEERKNRIEFLKEDNVKLQTSIDSEKKHIAWLRGLILEGKKNAQNAAAIDEINELLQSSEDDEDVIPQYKND